MGNDRLTRRTVLRTAALATSALAAPFGHVRAGDNVAPAGSMVLAWHTNIAPRWLDPLQHDGGATPDNFLNVVQDALIKNFREQALRSPGARRAFRICRGCQERDFPAAAGHQIPQRRSGHAGRCQMELRALPRRLGHGAARQDRRGGDLRRPHCPLQLQATVPRFSAADRYRKCLRRGLGGAGEVLSGGRAGRVCQEPDRCRPLQARLTGAGNKARIRGFRRLLPAGARQEIHDRQRDGPGDARGDARARRSGHHLLYPRRAGRAGAERSEGHAGAGRLRATGGSNSPAFRTPRTRFTTSACARPSALRSTATR